MNMAKCKGLPDDSSLGWEKPIYRLFPAEMAQEKAHRTNTSANESKHQEQRRDVVTAEMCLQRGTHPELVTEACPHVPALQRDAREMSSAENAVFFRASGAVQGPSPAGAEHQHSPSSLQMNRRLL